MDARNFVEVASILVAYVVLYMCFAFPVVVYLIAYQFVNNKTYKDKDEFLKNYDSVIGFFQSENVMQSGFFAVVAIRKFIFAFFLVYFNDYPGLDLGAFIVLNLSMIGLILKYRPY